MRIWIINHYAIPPSLGGLVRHYYITKFLQRSGNEVKLFTSSKIHNSDVNMITDGSLYVEKEMDGIEYTFVRGSNYKGNGIARIKNMLEFPVRIWKVCKKFEKPDVIYTSSPSPFTAFSAILMAKHRKVKVVLEVRDLWPESIVEYNDISRKNPIVLLLYQLEKWLYKNADRIVFTMEGGKQYIQEKGWDKVIDLNKVHHVNNGVDLEEFDYNRDKFQIEDEDLDNPHTYKIIYTGSLRKANSQIFLLFKAIELMQGEEYRDYSFLIYGRGEIEEELKGICKEKHINNVKFKGYVEKKYIPYILSKCDLNVLNCAPSKMLRFGGSQNKLFDYLASGRPILAGEDTKYSITGNEQCGISRHYTGAEDVVDAIKEIRSGDFSNTHIRKVAEQYDYNVLTEKIIKIIEEMIEE